MERTPRLGLLIQAGYGKCNALLLLIGVSNINGQVIINFKFKPLTYEDIMLSALAENASSNQFEEYVDKAYERLNHNDYNGFVSYKPVRKILEELK